MPGTEAGQQRRAMPRELESSCEDQSPAHPKNSKSSSACVRTGTFYTVIMVSFGTSREHPLCFQCVADGNDPARSCF